MGGQLCCGQRQRLPGDEPPQEDGATRLLAEKVGENGDSAFPGPPRSDTNTQVESQKVSETEADDRKNTAAPPPPQFGGPLPNEAVAEVADDRKDTAAPPPPQLAGSLASKEVAEVADDRKDAAAPPPPQLAGPPASQVASHRRDEGASLEAGDNGTGKSAEELERERLDAQKQRAAESRLQRERAEQARANLHKFIEDNMRIANDWGAARKERQNVKALDYCSGEVEYIAPNVNIKGKFEVKKIWDKEGKDHFHADAVWTPVNEKGWAPGDCELQRAVHEKKTIGSGPKYTEHVTLKNNVIVKVEEIHT